MKLIVCQRCKHKVEVGICVICGCPNSEDKVNRPSHYTFGNIEVIDYIKDKLTVEQLEGYCIGNVMKYISRYRHKGGIEDLKKAQVYLVWAIESMEG